MDSDVHIHMSIDESILANNDNSSMIVTFEEVPFVNFYNDWYHLSNQELMNVSISSHICTNHSDTYYARIEKCIGHRRFKNTSHPSSPIDLIISKDVSSKYIVASWLILSKPGDLDNVFSTLYSFNSILIV